MNKYGIEHFHIEKLEECSAEDSSKREEYWIAKLNTYGHTGYNATRGGDSKKYYDYKEIAEKVRILSVDSKDHYGVHYQDILHRVPSIKNAQTFLGWSPTVDLREALKRTLDYHLTKPNLPLNDQEAA